ncbi:DUF1707 and DUF4190 domain-containing protein [Streptomyces sp. P17]|uniref:DUF1707 and DUF4190 domain-containing protein n=1 Tax=Streptomyces sp. P17 TaxID=3074716 RepID=UPI0028F40D5F|nr:DUF1707 and DUF4190 domain-containing protein [Streptomyces sp. P17]MDT9697913.1 DUF1707 and DUF4190 domain-containing protein [Streptomyces sp. P17]
MSQPSWQPWQSGGVPQPWGSHSGSPAMLASHADRERAVDVLRAGYGEGRLEQPEFEKRVARAYAARTVGELGLLVADLPNGPVPHMAPFIAVPQPRTNGKAVGAGVCGVLCLVSFGLTGIPAVVLGHSARAEIRRTGEGGDGLALTGLVLGWLSTAGWVLFLTVLMVAAAVSG